MTMNGPAILDCTLRDGSYVIDFQFSAQTTEDIVRRLSQCHIPYIEVGHGIGLGASEKGMGKAAASDENYMRAARRGIGKSSKWGMFCIPGIASLEDIDLAESYEMGFIRVGCEVGDAEESKPFIEKARRAGMYVFSNLMKSYAAPVDYFVEQARKCLAYGSQCIYIVDSAGGMLPGHIVNYAQALREKEPGVKLGFHGHNNLGLGVANALTSAEMGFDVIDVSLQGLGRSGGNVPFEQYLCALIRAGYKATCDPIDIMQIGEDLVRPLIEQCGLSSLDVTAGFAEFHSSYMPRVLSVAREARVDPRRLILEICKRDKLNAPLSLLKDCAASLARGSRLVVQNRYHGQEQS